MRLSQSQARDVEKGQDLAEQDIPVDTGHAHLYFGAGDPGEDAVAADKSRRRGCRQALQIRYRRGPACVRFIHRVNRQPILSCNESNSAATTFTTTQARYPTRVPLQY